MQTLQNVTNFAIFLILVNAVFFIYLTIVSKHIISNRNNLREATRLLYELLDVGGEVLTYEEEELVKEKLADIEDKLDTLY